MDANGYSNHGMQHPDSQAQEENIDFTMQMDFGGDIDSGNQAQCQATPANFGDDLLQQLNVAPPQYSPFMDVLNAQDVESFDLAALDISNLTTNIADVQIYQDQVFYQQPVQQAVSAQEEYLPDVSVTNPAQFYHSELQNIPIQTAPAVAPRPDLVVQVPQQYFPPEAHSAPQLFGNAFQPVQFAEDLFTHGQTPVYNSYEPDVPAQNAQQNLTEAEVQDALALYACMKERGRAPACINGQWVTPTKRRPFFSLIGSSKRSRRVSKSPSPANRILRQKSNSATPPSTISDHFPKLLAPIFEEDARVAATDIGDTIIVNPNARQRTTVGPGSAKRHCEFVDTNARPHKTRRVTAASVAAGRGDDSDKENRPPLNKGKGRATRAHPVVYTVPQDSEPEIDANFEIDDEDSEYETPEEANDGSNSVVIPENNDEDEAESDSDDTPYRRRKSLKSRKKASASLDDIPPVLPKVAAGPEIPNFSPLKYTGPAAESDGRKSYYVDTKDHGVKEVFYLKYKPLPSRPRISISYDQRGYFQKSVLFTPKMMVRFIKDHPLGKSLFFRLERAHREVTRRIGDGKASSRMIACRSKNCVVSGDSQKIQYGSFRVAVDEVTGRLPRSKKFTNDPFFAAGYFHLECFETLVDIGQLIRLNMFRAFPRVKFPDEEPLSKTDPNPLCLIEKNENSFKRFAKKILDNPSYTGYKTNVIEWLCTELWHTNGKKGDLRLAVAPSQLPRKVSKAISQRKGHETTWGGARFRGVKVADADKLHAKGFGNKLDKSFANKNQRALGLLNEDRDSEAYSDGEDWFWNVQGIDQSIKSAPREDDTPDSE